MKHIICVFFLVCLKSQVYSQVYDSVSKIIFKYEKGGSSWGKPGVYNKIEIIEFERSDQENSLFKLTGHTRVQQRTALNEVNEIMYFSDTNLVSLVKGEPDSILLSNFIDNISRSEDNFNAPFILPYFRKINKSDIKRITRNTEYWKRLFGEYSTRQQTKEVVAQVQKFVLLDSFIAQKKDEASRIFMSTDVWDYFTITIVKNSKDTLRYWAQLTQPLFQPLIYKEKYPYKKEHKIYNLQVNILMNKILPSSSQLKERIGIGLFQKDYILWYLQKIFG